MAKRLTLYPSSNRKRKFRSRRPKWVDPNEYLDAAFQNLFELSYFTGSKELVPVGWSSVDEDKDYPRLSSRDQHTRTIQEDDRPHEDYSMTNGRTKSEASSDAEEDDAPQLVAPTQMNDESSDDDEAAPTPNIPRVSINTISHISYFLM